MVQARSLLALLIAAAALTGCGGPADTPSASSDRGVEIPGDTLVSADPDSAAADRLVCADKATPVPMPTVFPRQVPIPPDAVLTGTKQRSGGRLVLTAVAPGTFHQTLAFMQRAYPAAGLKLAEGEVEDRDAESDFSGNGLIGRWTLREIPDCDGDTLVTVLVANA